MLQQYGRRTHHIGEGYDGSLALRVYQHLSARMLLLQSYYIGCGETLVHVASAVPEQHVPARHTVDVRAQIIVRSEDKLLVLRERVHYLLGVAARHHDVRKRLHGSRGVHIAHHLVVWVLLPVFPQVLRTAGVGERASRIEVRTDHGLIG